MSSLILPRRFASQPQGAVEVDLDNPLGSGLKSIYLPTSRGKPIVLSGNASIAPYQKGMAYNSGANGIINIQDSSSWTLPDTQKLTMAFVGRINSVDSPWGGLFVKRKAANNSPGPMVQRDNTSDIFRASNGGNNASLTSLTISSLIGKDVVFVITMSGASGATTVIAYIDGYQADTATIGAWINTDSTGDFLIGAEHTANTAYGADVNCNLFSVWGRVLSNLEISQFSANPWQIFRAPNRVLYFDVGGGAPAAELAGSAQATATSTGTLTTAIPLTAAAAVVASAAGALSTSIPLSGSAASIGIAAGTLTTQITLNGAALAQASAAGMLASNVAQLAGAASASASAAAILTTQISLSGAAVAQALAAADLTAPGLGLSGSASAQASAVGALLTQIPLAATPQASATAAGGLTTQILLDAAAASVSSATGALTLELTLSGAALATALASASLTTSIALDAAALARAAATGSLSGGVAITAKLLHLVEASAPDWTVHASHGPWEVAA